MFGCYCRHCAESRDFSSGMIPNVFVASSASVPVSRAACTMGGTGGARNRSSTRTKPRTRSESSLMRSRAIPHSDGDSTPTSPVKSATHLPPLDLVGQTDRMMTQAEALETLAREDPAVADDARKRTPLADIRRRPRRDLAAETPGIPVVRAACGGTAAGGGVTRVTRALARLFTLAGMERYAEVCASEETAQILTAYATRARKASRPTPGRSPPPTPCRRTPTCSPGPRSWGQRSAPPTTRAPPRSSSRSPPVS